MVNCPVMQFSYPRQCSLNQPHHNKLCHDIIDLDLVVSIQLSLLPLILFCSYNCDSCLEFINVNSSREHELHDSQLCHDELCELFLLRICVPEDAIPPAIDTL